MDRPFREKILLVGEGDFSLSVSLLALFPREKLPHIVTTSLESDISIKKHKGSAENIAVLQQHGVSVKFCIDATKLHEDLRGTQFERIIFNFPHVGGKSNLKKNRALLNDFFQSANQVLDDSGQIMVTLCKGQGGTPADQPMRAWHDSWQVVSMAANSGLILTEVVPFESQKYREYSSTGFRSQDKWFHTEGALTHIFEKSEAVMEPNKEELSHYLSNKYNRPLHQQDGNPVCEVKKVLEGVISINLQTQILDPSRFSKLRSRKSLVDLCNLLRVMPNTCDNFSTWCYSKDLTPEDNAVFSLVNCNTKNKESLRTEVLQDSCSEDCLTETCSVPAWPCEDLLNTCTEALTTACEASENKTDPNIYLRTSMLQHLTEVLQISSERPSVISGDVYRPCLISSGKLPVCFQMMTVIPVLKSSSENSLDKCIKMLNQFCNVIEKEYLDQCSFGLKVISAPHEMSTQDALLQLATTELSNSRKDCSCVGSAWIYNSSSSNSSQEFLVILLDLSEIAMVLYGLPCMQLLWATDQRITKQFCKQESSWPYFKEISLFPMKFGHDMSFWENKDKPFDEMFYCDIIRNVGGDVITSVEMIDRYKDEQNDRTSRCYKLTFLSFDKALCYNTSWKIQSLVRLQVERQMSVTLR